MQDPVVNSGNVDQNNDQNKVTGTKASFIQKAIAELSNLTRLEVRTEVGNFTFNVVGDRETTIKAGEGIEKMCTQINLLSGDITTAMTEKFVVEYKELREYHMIRETQGHAIIEKNIKVLKDILDAILHFENPPTQPNK